MEAPQQQLNIKKEKPKLFIEGKEYRDDLNLKAFKKKEKKAKEVILAREKKSEEELFSIEPTPYLYLCNLGAGSQPKLNQENVIQFFKKYNGFLRIEADKSKPWLILVFDTPQSAFSVASQLHGKYSVEDFDRYFIFFYATPLSLPPDVLKENKEIIPDGLKLIQNFVNEVEEKELIDYVVKSESGDWEILNRRKVKHWGYKFDYKTKLISSDSVPPVPEFFQPIINKIVSEKILDFTPDQITVNIYEPGDGIPGHIETHSVFEDGIVALSLESQIVLEMRHPDNTIANILLTPRSLLVLQGESRYLWTHGISCRKTDLVNGVLLERGHRVSITFRKVRIGVPCKCSSFAQCDSMLFDSPGSEQRENSNRRELCERCL
jgi:alkylated DNA repair protein alkB family protein 8